VARSLARINPDVFQAIWNKAREEQPRITKQTIYNRIKVVRKEYGNLISQGTAANLLASRMDIDVYRINKDQRELDELKDLSRTLVRGVLKETARQVVPKRAKLVSKKKRSKKIFVVHGRDNKPVEELKKMLKRFGLEPIVLQEQAGGSMTIIEQLEKCSKNVEFAFVLLTPDDALITATKVGDNYVHSSENPIFRARQNVILEFGYFISKIGRKNVRCLYKGVTELPFDMPSDMHGIVYLPFRESVREAKEDISKQLKAVGYDLQGRRKKRN
jgi:predicted nucleotide-binding protein